MNHFRKIFWGLLLLDLTLCDVRCAALAYLLLALGAAGLVPASRRFRTAAVLGWAGLIWCLVSVWLLDLAVVGQPRIDDDSILYTNVRTLIDCGLIWVLLGGIAQYTDDRGRRDFARRAGQLRIAYLVIAFAGLLPDSIIARGAPPGFSTATGSFALVCFVAWLVWLVVALRLIYRVPREVRYEPAADEADRPWQFSLRTLLLMPVALWLLLMAFFPKLMTGDFCDVRIDELSGRADGHVNFGYTTRTSSGTRVRELSLPDVGTDLNHHVTRSPPWPTRGGLDGRFTLNPDRKPVTAEELRDRFLVEQGGTYRVAPGKPLYFYDFKDANGARNCRYLVVEPGSRLGF
jgi:hypothetical protein